MDVFIWCNYILVEQQQPNPSDVFLIKNLPPLNEGWIIWDMCNEPS